MLALYLHRTPLISSFLSKLDAFADLMAVATPLVPTPINLAFLFSHFFLITFDSLKRQQVRERLKKMGPLQPMNIFLRQEIDRMQRIIVLVRNTLTDLKLAIDGTIIMSENLRDALDCMYDARIPARWMRVRSGSSVQLIISRSLVFLCMCKNFFPVPSIESGLH